MGYWVRDRSGQDHYFEDNIPEDVAMARVRRMDDPQSVGSGNFFGDMNEYIQEGIGNVGSSIGSLITMLDPTAEGARERGDVPIGDQLSRASRDYGRRYGTEHLSPEALEARYRESPLYNEDTGVNWRNILGSSVSSVPFMGATMATGTVAGLAGASPGVSAGISAATEGALGGGSVADAIDESIRDIAASDPDTFINSELGQEALRQTDGNYARAVELAANRAKGIAPATAGALTGIIGRAIGPNWFATAGGRNALAKAVLSGAMREGTEEFLQSMNEQVGQNYGVGQIDPEVQLTDNVLESGIMGALSAAPMGGGMGAAHEIYSRFRNRRAAEQGMPESAGPEIEGPAMPPPGHPARGPATGDGNPAGWTAPDTAGAEDADYAEPGERQITGAVAPQEQAAPEDVQPDIEEEAATPDDEAKIKAEDYASQYEGQGWDKNDDADYAGALRERFQSLGMAARGNVPKRTKGATRRVEPVPLFKYNRDDIEGADEDAHAIYSGSVSEGRDVSETETFKAYGDIDNNLFADEEGDPAEAAGYGLRIIDTMPDGTERVSYLDIGAQSAEEAQAEAERIAPQPKPAKSPEPAQEAPKATEPAPMPEGIPEAPVEDAPPTQETGTEVVPTNKIKTLKPAANAALNAYRQQGEQGLQKYLAGLNVTASKSLLRNLGGQVGRSDNLPTTQGKIVQRVRGMAKSADKRGLPAPEAIQEEAPQEIVAPVQEQEVEPVAPEATKIEPVREQKPQKEDVEIVELPKRETRSPNQIKSALRDIAILEDDEYDSALPNVKITPEEASAVREAMKHDKGLDNLRQVFNDVLASQRKAPKKSRQTEAPAAKKKAAEPKEKKEKTETPERARKNRDAADRNLAQSISRGLPKDYDVVRRSVEQWLEVERDRQGIRSDQLWYKQWPLARQEELINRVWNHVNGRGGARESRAPDAPTAGKRESRDYAKGRQAGDLNPLQMFSRAERMANEFPEERSTRMHMVRWLEKRVRKAELKFIDMSEFLRGGETGNALKDRATRQELIDYIKSRKLRLTVRYNYGNPYQDKASKFAMFTQDVENLDHVAEGLYAEYTLLGEDVRNHNYMEVAIKVASPQPGSHGSFGHFGGEGTIAGILVSDMPIDVNGETINAFAVHQGQSDYHDADASNYKDLAADEKTKKKEIERLQGLIRNLWPEGRPLEFRSAGFRNADGSETGLETITVSNPGDIPRDDLLSSAIGVGGRGLPDSLMRLINELDEIGRHDWQARDINAPYRDTHPELMFRVAFMMAVSSGHDALVWPTADTIRMYPGHSTYKGDFYDKRWPGYAESWLGEWNPTITEQEINYANGENFDQSTEEFIQSNMRDESRDLAGDLVPTGIESEVESAFYDALTGLSEEFSQYDNEWATGLGIKERMDGQNGPPNRYDIPYYNRIVKEAKQKARKFLDTNTEYHDALFDDETSPSEQDVRRVFTDFAEGYIDRLIDVAEQAYEREGNSKGKKAEVYVLRITPDMRSSFLESGIPMFSKDGQAEDKKPIQARDLPITNKKWVNEMERAIKAASKCAAAAGAPALSPVAIAVAGLGLGGLASAPIAYLLGKEGIEQSRFEAMSNRTRELRRQYGLGSANDYIDESGEYNAPPFDEDGFVEPHVPQPRETFSPAELAAAEQEARDLGGPALDVTPEVIYRQAVIRRHNLRRPLTALSAPETPIEEFKAPE